MIGALQGTVFHKSANDLIIMVSGVGYLVEATYPLQQYALGDSITAFIYTHVREDALKLFAFVNEEELHAFELLLTVSGIGPKSAMHIVSIMGTEKLFEAVVQQDRKAFKGVSGLGTKGVEKLLLELKSKIEKIYTPKLHTDGNQPTLTGITEDLETALLSLGYSPAEIKSIEDKMIPSDSLPDMVKEALHLLRK